jgi:heptosyltransferase-2
MTGSDASAWNSPDARILVVAPNWLGDGIMAMPALQALRQHLLARPHQAGLWRMHSSPRRVIEATSRAKNLRGEIKSLRREGHTHALLLPHSFRSALLPFLGRIPHRRGTSGGRRLFINDPVDLSPFETRHQQWENAALVLGQDLPESLPVPALNPPEKAVQDVNRWLADLPHPLLAVIPGAARGPSKQWPADRFQTVASAWQSKTGGTALWLGTSADRTLCQDLAARCGNASRSFAGETSLSQFTALLTAVDAVAANDSGGMHLAAAVGTPVVAVFGRTDPDKTGPLYPGSVVVRAEGLADRAIGRHDETALQALASIEIERVQEPVLAIAGWRG